MRRQRDDASATVRELRQRIARVDDQAAIVHHSTIIDGPMVRDDDDRVALTKALVGQADASAHVSILAI